jgi:hypothetical protein
LVFRINESVDEENEFISNITLSIGEGIHGKELFALPPLIRDQLMGSFQF